MLFIAFPCAGSREVAGFPALKRGNSPNGPATDQGQAEGNPGPEGLGCHPNSSIWCRRIIRPHLLRQEWLLQDLSTIARDANCTNIPIGRPLLDRTIYAFIVDPTGVMA